MSTKKKASALSSYEDNPEKMGDVLTKMITQGSANEDDIKFYIEAWGRRPDPSRAQTNFCNTILTLFRKGYGSYVIKWGGAEATIGILKQCAGDVELSIVACQVLGVMLHSEFEEDVMGKLKEENGIKALVKVLSERLDDAELQKVGVSVVQCLVPDTGVQKIICDNDGIERIMHILILHQRDREIQLGALKILAEIASTDEQRALIIENLGIDSVTTGMRYYLNDPEVLGACCKALGYIVVSLELAMALPSSLDEAFKALYTAPVTSPTSSPLASKKSKSKSKSSVTKGPNDGVIEGLKRQIRAVNKDAIPLIVSAIEAFIDDPEIQKWGCFALGTMSYKNPITSTDILDGGGVDAVLLVASHATIPTVLESVMYSLSRLAMDDACAQQIWDSCGVKMLLDRAKSSSHHPGILSNVFVCLGYLACNPRASSEIGMVGGIKPIVTAMESCPKDEDLQRSAVFALGRLALNPGNSEMIMFDKGVVAAIKAMHAFPDDNGIQQFGIDFLVNVSCNHPSHVLSAGGVSVVEAALKTFINDPVLQSSCAALIENMACSSDRTQQHFPANLIIAIGRSFKKHIKEPEVVEAFARATANIAIAGPTVCENLLEYGVASHALYAFKSCKMSHSLGLYLARFLANILVGTPRGAAKQRCFAGNMITELTSLMAAYPHSLEMQYECSRAIAALVTGSKVPSEAPAVVASNAELFMDAVETFFEDNAVVRSCSIVLSVAIAANEADVVPVISGPIMLRVMRLHSGDVKLQVACCEVLNVLVNAANAKKSEEAKKKSEEKKSDDDKKEGSDEDKEGSQWMKEGMETVSAVAKAAEEALIVQKAIMKMLKMAIKGEGGKGALKKKDIDTLTNFAKNVGGKYGNNKDVNEFVLSILQSKYRNKASGK